MQGEAAGAAANQCQQCLWTSGWGVGWRDSLPMVVISCKSLTLVSKNEAKRIEACHYEKPWPEVGRASGL